MPMSSTFVNGTSIATATSANMDTKTSHHGGNQVPLLPQPASSWEDMEYGGLDLSGLQLPTGVIVKNTFIACPNVRSSSLDDCTEDRGWKSCPNSGIMMTKEPSSKAAGNHRTCGTGLVVSEIQSCVIPEELERAESESTSAGGEDHDETSSTTSQNDDKDLGELPEGTVVRNTFIDYPMVRSPSLDEYLQDRGWKSAPGSRIHSEVENQLSEMIQASVIPGGEEERYEEAKDEEQEEPPMVTLNLLDHLPCPRPAAPVFSVGSIPHQMGQICKPCGFVHKPEGCSNGANCQYCHLCPPGTIKQIKKVKKVMMRQRFTPAGPPPAVWQQW